MPRRKRRTYGAGTVYRRRDRGTWSIAWRAAGKRHQSHGFETEDAARKQLAVELGDAAAGKDARARGPASLNQLAAPWLLERKATHRSAYDDANRWTNHVAPALGRLRPDQVTVGELKAFCAARRRAGLSTTTVSLLVRLLSTLYTDLVESGAAASNPCRALSRTTRRQYLRAAHDPRLTPYLDSLEDVARVYQALAATPSIALAFAVGALAGLRTAEVQALDWEHVNLAAGTIQVQVQIERRQGRDRATWHPDGVQVLKSGRSRVVPVQPSLRSILAAAHGRGLVCPPPRARARHLSSHELSAALQAALVETKLARKGLRWYQATRHTFASLFVVSGGSLEVLRQILGHATVATTERYAHLRPGHFSLADRNRFAADFTKGERDGHGLERSAVAGSGPRG